MSKVYEIVTQKLIDKLEQGVAPWKHYTGRVGFPKNYASGKAYSGINTWMTSLEVMEHKYPSNEWLTFKQCVELGGQVKKGSKSTPILFCAKKERDDGTESFCVRFYSVFNIAQCEGLESKDAPTTNISTIEKADSIINKMPQRPNIVHKPSSGAYYSPMRDEVTMPESYTCSSEEYYSVLFHELAHSTGHESRLKRESLTKIQAFGDHEYSKEELVAEMTAAFLCAESGIEQKTLDNSAAYCAGWLKKLKNDRSMLIQAASQATKAANFILGSA